MSRISNGKSAITVLVLILAVTTILPVIAQQPVIKRLDGSSIY